MPDKMSDRMIEKMSNRMSDRIQKECVTRRAYGKINLGLDVLGKREDGYHLVSMVMQTVTVHDVLRVRIRQEENAQGNTLVTDAGDIPVTEDNLVLKAAKALQEAFGIEQPVEIHLTKNIPVAAGMAGGSTDAAATLLSMAELFGLGTCAVSESDGSPETGAGTDCSSETGSGTDRPSETGSETDCPGGAEVFSSFSMQNLSAGNRAQIEKIALSIGADVPYCLYGGTMLSEGIGEVLTPLSAAPGWHLVIAKPPFSVRTQDIYRGWDALENPPHPDIESLKQALRKKDPAAAAKYVENTLEAVTAKAYPLIGALEAAMEKEGAFVSRMTGSGPTVFGLFLEEEAAKKTAEALQKEPSFSDCTILQAAFWNP